MTNIFFHKLLLCLIKAKAILAVGDMAPTNQAYVLDSH